MAAERLEVVVVGGGPAGLAVSHELTALGIEHVVLERGRVGQTWRDRWDSFCLVTPNWTVALPGGVYAGDEPEGFMLRDRLVTHLERYAAGFGAPVREGIEVFSLRVAGDGALVLATPVGEVRARSVVLATGAYQRPYRPAGAGELPAGLPTIDAEGYTNPGALPPGRVLVVGSGQTGCQLADELRQSGREVYLACGRVGWLPRRLDGRDSITWLAETHWFEMTPGQLPSPQARLGGNVQLSGRDGGREVHYRALQERGVQLFGHFRGSDGKRAFFASDLAESVAFGDTRYGDIRELLHSTMAARGERAPEMPDPPPFRAEPDESVDLEGFGAVIFTSGFRPDYRSWVSAPGAFDEMGFPLHEEGASTAVPGLYFCGVHFLRKRKSSLLFGVGEDAAIVAAQLAERHSAAGSRSGPD